MNYLKVYCNLIRKAENRTPPEGYTEKHHTFPKSIFGKNNRIVVLTAREHYIAHALLEKTFIGRYGIKDRRTIKMTYAHTAMKGNGGYINSYLYESARKRRSESMKGGALYIPNEEHKEKMRQRRLGIKASEETKRKISEAMKGKNNPNYGKTLSEEHKNKLSEIHKGKTISEETKRKMSEANMGKKQTEKQKQSTSLRSKQMWENGVFSTPEFREKLSQSLCKNQYELIDNEGKVYYTNNILKFSKEHNLGYSGMYRAVKQNKKYKGWTVKILIHHWNDVQYQEKLK